MGAAESISDLRSLLSIVAEETGALKMNDADEDSVGWTTEGPLPMTFGHVRRAHSALAALEVALSAVEPVAWLPARRWEQMTAAEPWLTNIVYSEDQAKFFPCIPLYAAPPAPSVAVKAGEAAAKLQRALDAASPNHKTMWVYVDDLRSALSAQVQDVAERDPKEIATWEDQQAFEAWAQGERYEMHQHPLHYLFMDPKTNAARQGWKAALQFARDRLPAAPAKQEG